MFFGHGITLTYRDIKDIAGALNDSSRNFSREVMAALPPELKEAFDTTESCDEQLLISSIFLKMNNMNLDAKLRLLDAIKQYSSSL